MGDRGTIYDMEPEVGAQKVFFKKRTRTDVERS
jgi:hypothetical protein